MMQLGDMVKADGVYPIKKKISQFLFLPVGMMHNLVIW
jgi:hypothetical protein